MNLQCTFVKTSWNEFMARFATNAWLIETPQVQSKTLSKSPLKQPRCKRLKRCSTKHFYNGLPFWRRRGKSRQAIAIGVNIFFRIKIWAWCTKHRLRAPTTERQQRRNYDGLNKATREITHTSWAVKTRVSPGTYSRTVICPRRRFSKYPWFF